MATAPLGAAGTTIAGMVGGLECGMTIEDGEKATSLITLPLSCSAGAPILQQLAGAEKGQAQGLPDNTLFPL